MEFCHVLFTILNNLNVNFTLVKYTYVNEYFAY